MSCSSWSRPGSPITRTIPNALPHDFKIATEVPAKNPDRFEIVFVGRLHPEKGIDILFDAYREFLVTATRPVRLRIVGPHARNCGGGGDHHSDSSALEAAVQLQPQQPPSSGPGGVITHA